MNTDSKTSKYTLISYKPNGERYEGCGDYVRFDSELELQANLTRDELRESIRIKIASTEDCCDSCQHNENPLEFAILKDGRPMAARGDNLSSFRPDEETDETRDTEAIFDEARTLFTQARAAKVEEERKAAEEAAKAAALAKKAADEAAARARDEAERRKFEELKAKFEPKVA